MTDEKVGPAGDGAGGLHPLHGQTQLIQRGNQGSSTEERRVRKEEEILANQTLDIKTIDGGRVSVCNTQGGGGQGVVANKGARVLDLPGDLAPNR